MKLMPSQKDEMLRAAQKQGLSPYLFEIIESTDNDGLAFFRYRAEPAFQFGVGYNSSYRFTASPWENKYTHSDNYLSWNSIATAFNKWVSYLAREKKAIEAWSYLDHPIVQMGSAGDVIIDNSPFTAYEYDVLASRMADLKEGIERLQLTQKQILLINEKLDEILIAAKTAGKFDWQAQLVGGLWTLVVAMTISPEVGKQIFELVGILFSSVLLLN